MPLYGASSPRGLYPGDEITLFDADTVAAGSFSIPFTLPPMPGGGRAELAISLSWTTAPTAVVALQIANDDATGNYKDTSTTSTNTLIDMLQASIAAIFCRLNVSGYSAGGALTAKVRRIS